MVKFQPQSQPVLLNNVINDFMVEGGDPMGTGRGGPGYHAACSVAKQLAGRAACRAIPPHIDDLKATSPSKSLGYALG